MKQVMIVAGGEPSLWPSLAAFSKQDVWIGVDRGSLFLVERGIALTLAVGDFDSLSADELAHVKHHAKEVITAQPEKDFTDTELAVFEALRRYPNHSITIIGASGGRWDHFLANLWLPLDWQNIELATKITLRDEQNSLQYFLPGEHRISKEGDKKYLAFICLTPVTGLSLYDAKYLLDKADCPYPKSYASNEFVGESTRFSFDSGIVAVIQSVDKQ
ncbi:thiamine diphosphokinase [Vagococcus zengguangii]|uniref:thiamine diphosphokinase n=1 Tax=Vagococcus zengguangii TaxID=2571750 RepID=UPI00110933AE|nr:thiamine diphosphokinase [Vagococcus zengguangii]TLG78450.1 thiamine diphosphokinase [Vagococcus zengguangii]